MPLFEIRRAVPYLQVNPLEEHITFYTNILGYEVVEDLRDEAGQRFWANLQNGESMIMLSSRMVHDHSRLTWLYVEDVDAAYAAMIEVGGEPFCEPTDQTHQCREFLYADPSGHIYVISQPI